jgi:hypothetical protein
MIFNLILSLAHYICMEHRSRPFSALRRTFIASMIEKMASANGLCTLVADYRSRRLKISRVGLKMGRGRNVERARRPRMGHPVKGLLRV